MMGSMQPIAAPSVASMKDVLEVLALINDSAKAKEVAKELDAKIKELSDLNNELEAQQSSLEKKSEELFKIEGVLNQKEKLLNEGMEELKTAKSSFGISNAQLTKREIELQRKIETLDADKSAHQKAHEDKEKFLLELEQKVQAMLQESKDIKDEYYSKLEKLKAVVGA